MSAVATKPLYQQIAIDVARRIVKGEFEIGSKIYGRSTLAGEYNVSPETIRRAIILLQDMNVVNVSQGSGIDVISKDEAFKFIDRFKDIESIVSLKTELINFFHEKEEIDRKLEAIVKKIIDYSDRLRNISPYNPLEIEVKPYSSVIGKTLSEMKFWQNTGGTVIAIRRGDEIILSPGPHAEIIKGDVLVVVGDEGILKRTKKFLNKR
ncbi:MAG: TrkA C-terminal domain-containing protein [Clostridiales bacterium]|nr:TrkA C-terminal domain-containing protein [Clostridiales bacterium]